MFALEYLKWALVDFFGRKEPIAEQRTIFEIDLKEVHTRDEFIRAISKHFPVECDHARFWNSFALLLRNLPITCTLRFQGWSDFERRMPRYASRIRRIIRYSQMWKTETYYVEYA